MTTASTTVPVMPAASSRPPLIGVLLLLLAACALAGCGGGAPKRVLGAPVISLQEIERVDGRWQARLRLDSPSTMAMEIDRLDWSLSLGHETLRGSTQTTLVLPPTSGDVLRLDLGDEAALAILTALEPGATLELLLEGEIHCARPKTRFPLRYQGRIRPTPGKPGSFR